MADQVTDCLLSLPSAVLVGIRVCARPPCREPGHCWESDTLTAAPALLELRAAHAAADQNVGWPEAAGGRA